MISLKIDNDGTKYWLNEAGEYHKDDGPAIEHADGMRIWFRNDRCHRIDGLAVEWAGGSILWYVDDCEYTDLDLFCSAAGITGKHKTLFLLKYSHDFKTTKQSS